MRRMIAPGVWQDMGPAAATNASNRTRIESGRLVGQMVPDASTGPSLGWAKRTSDPTFNQRRNERRRGESV